MTASRAGSWALPAAAAGAFAGLWAAGRTFFWGDLTYIHFPWRAFAAEELAAGRLPLWDPYVYLGMPLAAQMQSGVWYPGTAPFHLFAFATALAVFHALHYGLVGLFAYLWLRRGGLAQAAALAGGAVFMACGILASRVPFLNHLSTLAYAPAFLLFARSPWLLGLSFALAFLSGYPLMAAGSALTAFALSWILERRAPPVLGWTLAAASAAGLGMVLLAPAVQLVAASQRGAGIKAAEILNYGLTPRDLAGFIAPWLASGAGSAAAEWWKACWFGAAATLAVLASVRRVKPRVLLGLGAFCAAVLVLALGGSTPIGRALWLSAPLRFVRYPGNLTYPLVPAAAVLAAAGLAGRKRAGLWAAAIGLELAAYAAVSQPLTARGYYTDGGTLVRRMQTYLGDHRYLLSPRALEWSRGEGRDAATAVLDFKHRLYGLTSAPYRLASVANFGEPLVPRPCFEVMDLIYTLSGLSELAPYLRWLDSPLVLTREHLPPGPLLYLGEDLWHGYRSVRPWGRAFWLAPEDGEKVGAALTTAAGLPDVSKSPALSFERSSPGAFRVRGETPAGWAYVSEPLLPGWRAWLDGRPARLEPAWRAFQKVRVPQGRWELVWRYRPAAFVWGLAVTLVFLCASAGYWYNRALSW